MKWRFTEKTEKNSILVWMASNTRTSPFSWCTYFTLVQFSSVMSDSLQPHELQHSRLPCPSPTPGVYSNSCALSRWCHPTISSSVIPFSSRLQSFPASGSFSNESALSIRWPEYWSFSFNISPSNDYSGLISFRMDLLDSLLSKGLSRVFFNTTVGLWKWGLLKPVFTDEILLKP